MKINIGDEFITKSQGDNFSLWVMRVKRIDKSQEGEDDDIIVFYLPKKNRKNITFGEDSARRWWINAYCIKIKR
jgi:hypothetical protein